MNPFIKNQLKNVKYVKLPPFNDDTTHLIIPKYIPLNLQENNYYLIKLNDSLLNPNLNTVLINNWNNGNIPTYNYYKIEVIKIMGQMVKINGLAFDYYNKIDLNESFNGWLILNQIDILEKL